MIRIRNYSESDINQAALLISKSFRQFNFRDNPPQSAEEYANFYDPAINLDSIRKRFEDTSFFLVAERGSQIVGLLRARENRIVNLFVHENFHGQGIGRKMIRHYEQDCADSGYREIVLRSQIYAVPFYQACGYKKTTGIRSKFGLIVQPMKKRLTADKKPGSYD